LEVPFDYFQNPNHQKVKDLVINPNFTLTDVPYFDLGGRILWGATAMIVSELLEVVSQREEARV
jgi:hypothetical protein